MKTTLDEKNKLLTVWLSGDLTSTNADALRAKLTEVLEPTMGKPPGWQQLRLDLPAAKMVDSVGLNLVVTILRAVQKVGGKMSVRYRNPNVLRTFEFTRLVQHIEMVKA
ncbi:MAG: hypothetical protein RL616_249 [Verrucomicrobiota bacterium]|jgi:anti-anti-sigma factor